VEVGRLKFHDSPERPKEGKKYENVVDRELLPIDSEKGKGGKKKGPKGESRGDLVSVEERYLIKVVKEKETLERYKGKKRHYGAMNQRENK